jgi:Cu-Zn family superoxide dismutase
MIKKSMLIVFSIFLLSLYNISCIEKMGQDNEQQINKAIAVMHPTEGNSAMGTITFRRSGEYITNSIIKIDVNMQGLTPGKHAIHIHEYGDCSALDASSAGGHYNPEGKPHGAPTDDNRHVGDLGNILADENGFIYTELSDTQIALNGPHSIIGRAVIIHENEDDFSTQPTGNAGPRIAYGIVGIAKE